MNVCDNAAVNKCSILMYHNEIDDDGSRLLVSIVNLAVAEMIVMLVVLEPRVCV